MILSLVLISISFLIGILCYTNSFVRKNRYVEIYYKNELIHERVNLDSLNENLVITLKKVDYPSLYGDFNIELSKEKGIRVFDVICPNNTCVNQGWVNIINMPIVCIPNDIRVKIINYNNDDIVVGGVIYENKNIY